MPMTISEFLCILSIFLLISYVVYLIIKEIHDLETSIHILSNEMETDETPVLYMPKRSNRKRKKSHKRRKTNEKSVHNDQNLYD